MNYENNNSTKKSCYFVDSFQIVKLKFLRFEFKKRKDSKDLLSRENSKNTYNVDSPVGWGSRIHR